MGRGLVVVSTRPRTFDTDLLTLLQGVAHQVGLAVSRAALLAETQEKSRRLEALARLAQGLTATLSGDQVLERVVGAAVELLGASMARLWLLDDDGQRLTLGALAGQVAAPELRSLAVGEGLVGLVVARGTSITMPDVQSDTRARNASRLSAEGIVSAAGVPLAVGARILGALAVGTTERHDYSEEELSLLQSLANQAAIAIDNARLFFEEQTRRAYLNALLEINTKIGTLAPTTTLLSSIAEEAARLLALDNAGFRLLEGDELVLAGMAGTAVQTMVRPRLRVGESLSGRVVEAGHSLLFDLDESSALVAEHIAADRRLGYTKFLGVPLKVGERTIGVLDVPRPPPVQPARPGAGRGLCRPGRHRARALASLPGRAPASGAHAGARRSGARAVRDADLDVVGQRVADSICALLGARASALYRTGPGGELLALATSRSGSFDWAPVLAPGTGMAGLAVRERQPVAGPDVLTDTRLHYEPAVRESRRPIPTARCSAPRSSCATGCWGRWPWPIAPGVSSTPRTRGWRRPSPTRRPWRWRTPGSTARRSSDGARPKSWLDWPAR